MTIFIFPSIHSHTKLNSSNPRMNSICKKKSSRSRESLRYWGRWAVVTRYSILLTIEKKANVKANEEIYNSIGNKRRNIMRIIIVACSRFKTPPFSYQLQFCNFLVVPFALPLLTLIESLVSIQLTFFLVAIFFLDLSIINVCEILRVFSQQKQIENSNANLKIFLFWREVLFDR